VSEEIWDDELCDHECFDNCDENIAEGGYYCHHELCLHCGQCGCPGYCDDHQTYNLRNLGVGDDHDEVEEVGR
jgi:hypothetical protein